MAEVDNLAVAAYYRPTGFTQHDPIHVGHVPPSSTPASVNGGLLDAILIDDDWLVHSVWKMAAKKASRRLLCFLSIEDFDELATDFSSCTPIYVDYELGASQSGEEVARSLQDRGYTKVFLATGHAAEMFSKLDWLEGVVGKEPPF